MDVSTLCNNSKSASRPLVTLHPLSPSLSYAFLAALPIRGELCSPLSLTVLLLIYLRDTPRSQLRAPSYLGLIHLALLCSKPSEDKFNTSACFKRSTLSRPQSSSIMGFDTMASFRLLLQSIPNTMADEPVSPYSLKRRDSFAMFSNAKRRQVKRMRHSYAILINRIEAESGALIFHSRHQNQQNRYDRTSLHRCPSRSPLLPSKLQNLGGLLQHRQGLYRQDRSQSHRE